MIRTYLETRESLKGGVVFILDIRRVPREEDVKMLDWLEEFGGVPTILVITKIDKVNRSQRDKQIKLIAAETGLPVDAFSLFFQRRHEREVMKFGNG